MKFHANDFLIHMAPTNCLMKGWSFYLAVFE